MARTGSLSPRIIYHRAYNIGALGLERLHPFDSRKYGRAMRVLQRKFGSALKQHLVRPSQQVSEETLLTFHSKEYLLKLHDPKYLAGALEVGQLAKLPGWLIDHIVLRPMRWATAGTILGAKLAFEHRLVFNMSGGYHHASADRGEGFSIYNDIALAIGSLRQQGILAADEKIVYVDCDAHQGNGVCRAFFDDPRVFIFDCFNPLIYPAYDAKAQRRIDCPAPLPQACNDSDYLDVLQKKLIPFLDGITKHAAYRFAIYNAGTDILAGDALGRLEVSADGVLKRDQFVINQLLNRGMNVLVLPSGGYTRESYRLIAATIASYLR